MSLTKQPTWIVFDFLGVIMPFGIGSFRSYFGQSKEVYFDPHMVALIRDLHRSGYKIGLASNSRRRWVLPALKLAGIDKLFDAVITPDDKVAKPDHAFYQLLTDRTVTPAAEILFVDDRSANVTAALEHGLQAIHYSGFEAFIAELSARGIKIPAKS